VPRLREPGRLPVAALWRAGGRRSWSRAWGSGCVGGVADLLCWLQLGYKHGHGVGVERFSPLGDEDQRHSRPLMNEMVATAFYMDELSLSLVLMTQLKPFAS
jgi:hypothetical protein